MSTWSGVFPAFTTPFRRDLSIDEDALVRHLHRMLDSGIHGVVMLGSLGENLALSREEKQKLMVIAKREVGGRVPVLAGVAETSSMFAAEAARDAERAGLDGIMLMPAMVYRADEQEALAHYTGVAAATDLPILIYNNPLAYPVDLTPPMLQQLCDASDKFVAIKESSGDPRRITDLVNHLGDRLTIFSGVDDLALECTLLGATGWVAGIGLAYPEENARLWSLMMAGQWDAARELYRWYTPLMHLDVGTKFVQKIKLAMAENGFGEEWVRPPRMPLSGAEREATLAIIRNAHLTRPKL